MAAGRADDLVISGATVTQIRVARPTDRLEEVAAFYRDGLGLPELLRFRNHAGYDGVVIGLPGKTYHLEFTRRSDGSPCPAPSADNLLVLYVPDPSQLAALCARLARHHCEPVAPLNPYWLDRSVTFSDPDGWRVVLCNSGAI